MRIHQLDRLAMSRCAIMGVLAVLCGNAWAVSGGCTYPANTGGTGMGGTGAPARDSGIGGTGISPQAALARGELAGTVIFSRGMVEAKSEGRTRALAKGASVCAGETIVTSPASQVQIRMADGGMISIRPETKIRINAFHFDGKEDGTERSEIALLQGRFRALTGMVGHTHKENYVIQTPNAFIGIRGTDHEPMYIPDPAPGQTAAGVPGTYDKVNSGGVVIRTSQGAVEVNPNQVGFAPNEPAAPPVLLKELPKFYHGDGAEGGHGPVEPRDGHGASGEAAGQEPGHGAEIHAPEPATEITAPEAQPPEMQTPEVRTPDD